MFNLEKTKIVVDEFGKLQFSDIYPIEQSLKALVDYIKDIEEENKELKEKLENYSKDEKIAKYEKEICELRGNSLHIMDEQEKQAAKEFSEAHFEKHGRIKACGVRYILTPTSIGMVTEVECVLCKERKDVTNIRNW